MLASLLAPKVPVSTAPILIVTVHAAAAMVCRRSDRAGTSDRKVAVPQPEIHHDLPSHRRVTPVETREFSEQGAPRSRPRRQIAPPHQRQWLHMSSVRKRHITSFSHAGVFGDVLSSAHHASSPAFDDLSQACSKEGPGVDRAVKSRQPGVKCSAAGCRAVVYATSQLKHKSLLKNTADAIIIINAISIVMLNFRPPLAVKPGLCLFSRALRARSR